MIIDLTIPIYAGMSVYPGDPEVKLEPIASIKQNGYANTLLTTSVHAGTHIDGLGHMLENQVSISDVPLTNLIGNAFVVDANKPIDILDVDFLIIKGQSKLDLEWVQSHLHKPLKAILIESDSPDESPYLVHKYLFSEGIYIVENLTNLESLPKNARFKLYIIPLKIVADSSPCRVFAEI